MRDWERGENDMNWKDFFFGFIVGAVVLFALELTLGEYLLVNHVR